VAGEGKFGPMGGNMANPLNMAEEIDFWSLFNRQRLHQNNRQGRTAAEFDEQKYASGIHFINQSYRSLFDSLSLQRPDIRQPIHALKRGFLIHKGFKQLENAPMQFWCVTFDLYNRGNPQDPNGPRRLIVILKNWPGGRAPNGRIIWTPDAGYFAHLIYTNNHYGDNSGGPSFAYVNNWPLRDHAAGKYSVLGNVAATFAA